MRRSNPMSVRAFVSGALLASAASAALAVPLTCTTEPATGAPAFTVELLAPLPGEEVSCRARVEGTVRLVGPQAYDVYVVVDSSGSTAGASGVDLDEDGMLGVGDWRNNTDLDDSTLEAEVMAVKRALEVWEPLDIRASIEEFSAVIPIPPGEPDEQGRIRTVQGLTHDFDLVRAGLDDILSEGSAGATDYGGALLELAAEFDRSGTPSRRPVAFFLSDGKPTFPRFPYDSTETPDLDWARAGAHEVAARGLPTNALEIGVFDDVGMLGEVADITGGFLLPRLEREAILDSLLSVDLDGFGDGLLTNQTNHVVTQVLLDATGSFSAEVPLKHGPNDVILTVVLRTPDGEWLVSCPFQPNAVCPGCTYTQGWWKTHHRYARNPSQQIPWPIDEDTQLCGQTWLDIFRTSPSGNPWYVLAHQYIATRLNQANGAAIPDHVVPLLDEAQAILEQCSIPPAEHARALELSGLFDLYNNGFIGPLHCGDEEGTGTFVTLPEGPAQKFTNPRRHPPRDTPGNWRRGLPTPPSGS